MYQQTIYDRNGQKQKKLVFFFATSEKMCIFATPL